MKKIVSMALLCSFTAANIASAQMTQTDDDMVEGLRQLVLNDGKTAPLVIVTHATSRAALNAALAEICALEASLAEPVALRIESL